VARSIVVALAAILRGELNAARRQYLFFVLAAPVVARLPRGLLSVVAVVCGAIAYVAARSARASVQRNLRIAVPDWSERRRRSAAVEIFVHGAWSYVELLALEHSTADDIRRGYSYSGWEHVERAMAKSRGVIIASGHVGAFSAAGQLLALNGAQTTVLVERLQPSELHDFVARRRESFGLRMLPADRTALRQVFTRLRRNEIVCMLCDRDVAGTGELLPFFGRPTRMTTAAATIARRTGAVVLPSVSYRTGLLGGVAEVGPPIEVPHTDDPTDDVRIGALNIIAYLETFIRAHPEQWVVFEAIWPPTSGTIVGTQPDPARE
jgi:phosphatidylinositol dimannoside acyltransferase